MLLTANYTTMDLHELNSALKYYNGSIWYEVRAWWSAAVMEPSLPALHPPAPRPIVSSTNSREAGLRLHRWAGSRQPSEVQMFMLNEPPAPLLTHHLQGQLTMWDEVWSNNVRPHASPQIRPHLPPRACLIAQLARHT